MVQFSTPGKISGIDIGVDLVNPGFGGAVLEAVVQGVDSLVAVIPAAVEAQTGDLAAAVEVSAEAAPAEVGRGR